MVNRISPNMMQLDDDPILASQIPKVKGLCQALGFGPSWLKFSRSLNAWRRKYKTASGASGMHVTNWALEMDRFDLGVMAQRYLETEEHARKHWPSSGRASPRIRPEYPRDDIEIANLLRRLFWRQNAWAAKNELQRARSSFNDDESTSAGNSPPIASRRRSTLRRSQLSNLTQDWSADQDTSWDLPSDASADSSTDSTGSLYLDNPNENTIQDNPLGCSSRQIIDLEDDKDEDGHGHGTLAKIVTLKFNQSQRTPPHQSPGGRAPVARMVTPPAGLVVDSFGPPSRSHPGNASPAQMRTPIGASPGPNDDDPDEEDDDEVYVPGRGSRQKRRHSSRSDASHCASKSTKRRQISESPKLGSARSSTMVGEEDSDDMPFVPTSRNKSWKSTNVAHETVTASKAYYDSGGANPSPSDTSPLGPLDGSALDPEDLIQRENNHARTFLGKDTPHYAHCTLHPSPTSDLAASRHVNNERTHARDGMELGDSDRSQMHSSPSWPNPIPSTQARNDQPGPVVKPGVGIFVIALCSSRFTIKKWPSGTLKDKKLNAIFDEVSALISRNEIQRINFKLETLKKENGLECLIERGDMAIFEVMIQKFNERIKERKKAGEAKFKILLEPDPEQQGAEEVKVAQDSESDGEVW